MADFEITCPALNAVFNSASISESVKTIDYNYFLDGKIYSYDGNILSNDVFEKIKKGAIPEIAPITINRYIEFFTPILNSGNDILHIDFSRYYSNNCKYAHEAILELKNTFPEREIHVIDSKRLGLGIFALVCAAKKLKDAGEAIYSTKENVEKLIENNIDLLIAQDFEYMYKKKYLSSTQKKFGIAKNTCALLNFDREEKLTPLLKPHGINRAQKEALQIIKNSIDNKITRLFTASDNEIESDKLKQFITQDLPVPVNIIQTASDIFTISKTGVNSIEILCFKATPHN